jgi:acyl carrier protein
MTNQPEVASFVCSTIALACNRDPGSVALDTSLLDLNMDSLTLVSVLAQVEAVYEVSLDTDDVFALIEAARVSDVVSRLEGIVGHR